MKKIFIFLLAVSLVMLFKGVSFAAGQTSTNGEITLGATDTVTVTLSSNVEANYYSATGDAYSASTYNTKGTGKAYGVASNSSVIYYKTGMTAPGTLSNGDSSDFSDWDTY